MKRFCAPALLLFSSLVGCGGVVLEDAPVDQLKSETQSAEGDSGDDLSGEAKAATRMSSSQDTSPSVLGFSPEHIVLGVYTGSMNSKRKLMKHKFTS